jgi:tetratricopeptide (TPR) repeat protein
MKRKSASVGVPTLAGDLAAMEVSLAHAESIRITDSKSAARAAETLLARIERLRAAHKNSAQKNSEGKLGDEQRLELLRIQARAYFVLGFCREKLSDYNHALSPLHVAYSNAQELGDKRLQSETLIALGTVHQRIAEYPKAIELFQESISISEAEGFDSLLAQALNQLGNLYENIGNPSKALDFFQKALRLREALGEKRGAANTLNNIAGLYLSHFKDYERCLSLCERSAELLIPTSDKRSMAGALLNGASALARLLRYDEAERRFRDALALFKEVGEEHGQALTLSNLGVLKTNRNDYRAAVSFFEKGMALYQSLAVPRGEADCLNGLSVCWLHLGDLERSAALSKKALSLSREAGLKREQFSALQNLGDIYEAMNRFKEALTMVREAQTLKEEISGEAVATQTRLLRIQFEVETKERENLMLHWKSSQLEEETTRQKKDLFTLAAALVEKNEFIIRLKEELAEIVKQSSGKGGAGSATQNFNQLLARLDFKRESEKSWKFFEEQFNAVHQEFLSNLKARSKNLTKTEQKICVLLKLNMTSKEIARALNCSLRNVENHRYRLRQKLALETYQNINSFLINL